MSLKTARFMNPVPAWRFILVAGMGALAAGCSDGHDPNNSSVSPPTTANAGTGSPGSGGMAGGGQPPVNSGMAGQGGPAGSGSMMPAGSSGGSGMGAAGDSTAAGNGGTGGITFVEAVCGADDNPETGLQGDRYTGTVNCGLTLLSELPVGGHVQGAGHCAYVRLSGGAYMGSTIKAYSLADPLNPVETDSETATGGSESMRAHTVGERAVLVSGSGVYDVSNCEDMVKKGDIAWPSANAQSGFYLAALNSHEISISHDAMRVYTGLGFGVADISNLDDPNSWTVKNWSCEMNRQSMFPGELGMCEGPSHPDVGRQYSHSSDDNLEGTVWYGANQEGSGSQMEPPTARMVDISDPTKITILDAVQQFPGHSMNWWRTPDGREFIIGANEGFGGANRCGQYPRPTNLGNALEAYIVEVTGNQFGEPFPLVLDVNRPENCMMGTSSNATITEHSLFNKDGAAFVMIEYGGAGLRVFDLRDGENPREVAYYNDGRGHAHSGVFHYDEARGIMLASGAGAAHVLMLQPQMIAALGLPEPTDPNYPYK
jgi:hypothetical protein